MCHLPNILLPLIDIYSRNTQSGGGTASNAITLHDYAITSGVVAAYDNRSRVGVQRCAEETTGSSSWLCKFPSRGNKEARRGVREGGR